MKVFMVKIFKKYVYFHCILDTLHAENVLINEPQVKYFVFLDYNSQGTFKTIQLEN